MGTMRVRHNAEKAYRDRYVVASPATGTSTFAGGIIDLDPDIYVDGMPRVVETCAHKHRSRAAAWSCAEELRDVRADEAADAAEREARTADAEATRVLR